MRKRIVLGSAVVALLMLVSTQIVFLNTVKSEPTAHPGDAEVGNLWIDELDVSAAENHFDKIGIAHVNATDDWVSWTAGTGNITANWSIEVESENHPEYFVIFSLGVYNIDNENDEVGNDTVTMTIDANSPCDDSGILKITTKFSEEMKRKGENTLLCYLGAIVKLNDTEEAVDFSSGAEDRSVIGVSFNGSTDHPFSRFTKEANDESPSMWSWIEGWDEGGKFEDEDDMLNTQTYFNVGHCPSPGSQQNNNSDWDLGNVTAQYRANGWQIIKYFDKDNLTIDWEYNTSGTLNIAEGYSYMNYSIRPTGNWNPPVFMRYLLKTVVDNVRATPRPAHYRWSSGDPNDGWFGATVKVDEHSEDQEGNIPIKGRLWVTNLLPPSKHGDWSWGPYWLSGYKIIIVEEANNSGNNGASGYYWEGACAYQNLSFSVDVDSIKAFGITTVYANIIEVLQVAESSGEFIYSFGGDSDDVRIEFTCEN